MNIIYILGAAVIFSIINWFSEAYSSRLEKYHLLLLSFSSGLFITYIFVYLFSEITKHTTQFGAWVFVAMLLGFVLFHLGEKYLYQHVKDEKSLKKDLSQLHIFGFFIDHFVVGVVLFITLSVPDIALGFLIIIPLLLHVVSSSLALTHIDEHIKPGRVISLLLATSPIFGVLFAYLLNLAPQYYFMLLSLVVGALLYIVVRDMMPRESLGRPHFFTLGVIISLAIILVAKSLVL